MLNLIQKPYHIKMELFQRTVNWWKPIPFVARNFVRIVAGFLDLPLTRLTLLLSLTIYSYKGASLESETDL